jgi:hypothetical protein
LSPDDDDIVLSQQRIDAEARALVASDLQASLAVARDLARSKSDLERNSSRSAIAALGAEVTKERTRRKAVAVAAAARRADLRAMYGSAALAPVSVPVKASPGKRSPRGAEALNLYTLAQLAASSGFYRGNPGEFAPAAGAAGGKG